MRRFHDRPRGHRAHLVRRQGTRMGAFWGPPRRSCALIGMVFASLLLVQSSGMLSKRSGIHNHMCLSRRFRGALLFLSSSCPFVICLPAPRLSSPDKKSLVQCPVKKTIRCQKLPKTHSIDLCSVEECLLPSVKTYLMPPRDLSSSDFASRFSELPWIRRSSRRWVPPPPRQPSLCPWKGG